MQALEKRVTLVEQKAAALEKKAKAAGVTLGSGQALPGTVEATELPGTASSLRAMMPSVRMLGPLADIQPLVLCDVEQLVHDLTSEDDGRQGELRTARLAKQVFLPCTLPQGTPGTLVQDVALTAGAAGVATGIPLVATVGAAAAVVTFTSKHGMRIWWY